MFGESCLGMGQHPWPVKWGGQVKTADYEMQRYLEAPLTTANLGLPTIIYHQT